MLPRASGGMPLSFKGEEGLNYLRWGAWCCLWRGILKWQVFEVVSGPPQAVVFGSLVLVTLHPPSTSRTLKGTFPLLFIILE